MAIDLPREGLEGREHTEIKGITFLRKLGLFTGLRFGF